MSVSVFVRYIHTLTYTDTQGGREGEETQGLRDLHMLCRCASETQYFTPELSENA